MKVAIVGTGYVGLVTGACLAELGHQVLCIDNNSEKICLLKGGRIPIYEPGLDEVVERNIGQKRLHFSTDVKEGVSQAELIFVAVNTPSLPDGSADLCYVEAVSKEIAENMHDYRLIVSKSTVPVETGQWIKRTIEKYISEGVEYDVASNPEFLREGKAVYDFLNPDRIVIGVESERAKEKLLELYLPLKDKTHILITSIESSELIKHASNSFLALKISYINAIANICDRTEADIREVALGMGLDRRIGQDFLEAGAGFGGSCFPKDLAAFIKIAEKLGYDFKLLKEVQNINRNQVERVVEKVKANFMSLSGKTIAVLGLAFKPDTDDMRNAPSVFIVRRLLAEGATVNTYDPVATRNAERIIGKKERLSYCKDLQAALEGAEAVLVLTDWDEFKEMDLAKLKERLGKKPIIVDGRNIFEAARMEELGISYTGMGR